PSSAYPTTFPCTVTVSPSPPAGAARATNRIRIVYTPQKKRRQIRVSFSPGQICCFIKPYFLKWFSRSPSKPQRHQQVDQFDPRKGYDHPTQSIDQQVPLQQGTGADGLIGDPTQREGYQQRDDDGIEDDRGQDRALRTVEPHDIQSLQTWDRGDEQRRHN